MANPSKPAATSRDFSHLPPYTPPTTPLFSLLPSWAIPYAELMRLHKPAGYWTFYFPHMYGTLIGAILADPGRDVSISRLVYVNSVFLLGSILLRGAACTWNDAIDAPFDRQVARCRHRPCARGAVSIQEAYIFTGLQAVVGLMCLIPLPILCTIYGVPLALLCGGYAFAKRFTDYPQVVLGFTLAVGQWVGAAAVGFDVLDTSRDRAAISCFYLANVICALVVDAVYSHQDLKDDLKAGVKSIAVAWQEQTKPLLWVLTTIQIGLLIGGGLLLELDAGYFLIAVLGTAAVSWLMVYRVDLGRPESCWWWFVNSIYMTGISLGGGLFSSYLFR